MIKNIEESKTLQNYCRQLNREGVALRIIELCKIVAKNENYKEAVHVAGRIKAITIGCKFDDYWNEKMHDGYYQELELAVSKEAANVKDTD